VQATRLAVSFKLLTGSVALTGQEKFPHKATCVSVFFSQTSPKAAGRQSVNTIVMNETFSIIFHLPHYKVISNTMQHQKSD